MQSVSPDLAEIIPSESRKPMERITIVWGIDEATIIIDPNQLTTTITTSRAVNDAPSEIGLIAGNTRASAEITLQGEYEFAPGVIMRATDLVPTRDLLWSMRLGSRYGVGSSVTIESGFLVNGTPEWVPVFTGMISAFSVSGDVVTISAIDMADLVRGRVDLPSAASVPSTFGASTTAAISPIAVEDLALRSAGFRLTPPTRPTALVSIPGCGSPLPELGEYRPTPYGVTVVAATGLNTPSAENYGMASCAPVSFAEGNWITVEGWVNCAAWPVVSNQFFKFGTYGSIPEFYLEVNSVGRLVAWITFNGLYGTADGVMPTSGWHYIAVAVKLGAVGQVIIRVDGTSHTSGAVTVSKAHLSETVDMFASWNSYQVEGFQMWKTTSAPTFNNTWVPNYDAVIEPPTARLVAVVAQTGVDAWGLIQETTTAEGAIATFDEQGIYRRETRATWNARRYGAPALTITGDALEAMSMSWGSEGLRKSVEAAVLIPQVVASTVEAPAWQATEVYTCPAKTTFEFEVATDTPLFNLAPTMTAGFQGGTTSNYRWAVQASAVGDPAAEPVAGVRVQVRATATGLKIRISNGNIFAIALWTPGDGLDVPAGPYLIVHGTKIVLPDPKILVEQASGISAVTEVLSLPDNIYRQNEDSTRAFLQALASDVAVPQIVFGGVQLISDPRIQLGDVVALDDRYLSDGSDNPQKWFDGPQPCLVIGIDHDLPGGDSNTTTLQLRACYPQFGWILDLPGRSELNTTTLLIF